jgi:hypothetical protein
MNWLVIVIGAVVGLVALIGLAKSILRLMVALVAGVLMSYLVQNAAQLLGLNFEIPVAVVIVAGALTALLMLIKS